jgi:hypothetical protein
VKRLLDEVEGICLSEQDQHWRSFQTARAVAHAAHGRALLARRGGPGAVAARRTALAAQPTFTGAHMQIAEAYFAFQEDLAKDWACHAKDELLLALRIANNCKHIQSSLAALYSSEALEKVPEAERIYRKLGELPFLSLWVGQFILDTKARECPALFPAHQYLSSCSGVSPASRKQLEGLVADLKSRTLGISTMTKDFSKLVGVAQVVLTKIETAGVALPKELLAAATSRLAGRVGGFMVAAL